MVADRDMEPVFWECVIWPSDDGSNIEGMVSGGIEVSVVADMSR